MGMLDALASLKFKTTTKIQASLTLLFYVQAHTSDMCSLRATLVLFPFCESILVQFNDLGWLMTGVRLVVYGVKKRSLPRQSAPCNDGMARWSVCTSMEKHSIPQFHPT